MIRSTFRVNPVVDCVDFLQSSRVGSYQAISHFVSLYNKNQLNQLNNIPSKYPQSPWHIHLVGGFGSPTRCNWQTWQPMRKGTDWRWSLIMGCLKNGWCRRKRERKMTNSVRLLGFNSLATFGHVWPCLATFGSLPSCPLGFAHHGISAVLFSEILQFPRVPKQQLCRYEPCVWVILGSDRSLKQLFTHNIYIYMGM